MNGSDIIKFLLRSHEACMLHSVSQAPVTSLLSFWSICIQCFPQFFTVPSFKMVFFFFFRFFPFFPLPCQWNLNFYSHHHLFFTADFSTCPARLIINEVLLNVFDWQIWHMLPCMLPCTATCTKYMTRWFSTAQILPATHMYIYYNDCEYSYIVLSQLTLSKQIGIFIKTVGFFGGFSVYKWATFWAVKLHLYKWGRLLCFCNIFFALFHLCKGAFL